MIGLARLCLCFMIKLERDHEERMREGSEVTWLACMVGGVQARQGANT